MNPMLKSILLLIISICLIDAQDPDVALSFDELKEVFKKIETTNDVQQLDILSSKFDGYTEFFLVAKEEQKKIYDLAKSYASMDLNEYSTRAAFALYCAMFLFDTKLKEINKKQKIHELALSNSDKVELSNILLKTKYKPVLAEVALAKLYIEDSKDEEVIKILVQNLHLIKADCVKKEAKNQLAKLGVILDEEEK
jgi:hypothetical protein